jgi:DNA invertase Pin-like site-specific DNA recombinase
MTTIGYARLSTTDQKLDIQVTALKREGCTTIRSEKKSGASTQGRDELRTVVDFLREGDVLMVTRIDRLAAKAKAAGVYKGRPPSIKASRVRELKAKGIGASEIAKATGIGRASVYRALGQRGSEASIGGLPRLPDD